MGKVAGVCLVHNAIDIMPALVGHYLRLGFDRLLFLDDRSTDGTAEFLRTLSRTDRRVSVETVQLRKYGQGALVTEYSNGLIADGFEFVFPFDSDEFWNVDLRAVRKAAHRRPACLFVGSMVQFVQDREVRCGDPISLLRVRHRAPALFADRIASELAIGTAVCFAKSKMAVRSRRPVVIGEGYHKARAPGPATRFDGIEVFHFMVRSRGELDARAERRTWGGSAGVGGDSKAGRSKWWAANSVRNGCVDTPGGPVMMIPDHRLRTLLGLGLAHFAARHPILLARAWEISRRPRQARRWSRISPPEQHSELAPAE